MGNGLSLDGAGMSSPTMKHLIVVIFQRNGVPRWRRAVSLVVVHVEVVI